MTITKVAQLKALREHAKVLTDGLGAAFCNCVPCSECPFRTKTPLRGAKQPSQTVVMPHIAVKCIIHIIEENLISDSAS